MGDPLFLLVLLAGLLLLAQVAWRLLQISSYLRFVGLVRSAHLDEAEALFLTLLRTSPRLLEGGTIFTQAGLDVRLLGLPLPDERVQAFFHGLARLGRELRPSSSVFLRLQANLLRQQGRLEEGRALSEEAFRLSPDDPANRQQRGWFLELSGDLEGAVAEYRAGLERLDASTSGLRDRQVKALRSGLWRALGQTLARLGLLLEAAEALHRALVGDPCSPEALVTRISLAGLQERSGEVDAALDCLRQGLRGCREGAGLLHQTMSRILGRAGRYDEAEAELDEAEILEPGSVIWRLARAEVENARGRPDRAFEFLEEAVAAEPLNPAVQVALARHHERLGDDSRAMVHLERAVESAPSGRALAALWDLSWKVPREILGDCYARLGRPEDAEREYRRALQDGSRAPTLRSSLGILLREQGRTDEGSGVLEEARRELAEDLRRAPGDPRLLHSMGSLLLGSAETAAALEHLERSARLGPGDFSTWRALGAAPALSGHFEEARRSWTRALELAARPDQANLARERLESLPPG